MYNTIGRFLFPSWSRNKRYDASMLEAYRRDHAESWCVLGKLRLEKNVIENAKADLERSLAEALITAGTARNDVIELRAYARDLEHRLQIQNATLGADFHRLAYATDAQIMADCKNFSESQKAAEIARLRKMMAREEARVYELARSNDALIARLKEREPVHPARRPVCMEEFEKAWGVDGVPHVGIVNGQQKCNRSEGQ